MAEGVTAVSDPACRVCSGFWPRRDHLIGDLGLSRAFLHDDQFFAGWTVLVLKRHATELFHLAPAERITLMEEVTLVAQALTDAFQARKINYELLGNQLPHIHWHLIPRPAQDPAPLSPVWLVQHTPLQLKPPELSERIRLIQSELQRHEAGQ